MGLFDKLFKKELPAIDMDLIQVDMHSHLIPGIDDGAKDYEESESIINGLKEMGYKQLITTPHIISDFYKNTYDSITEQNQKLNLYLEEKGKSSNIKAAAEYYLDSEFMDLVEQKKLLTLGDSDYVLFELSMVEKPYNLKDVIFKMLLNGYKPVLAHPERYSFLAGDLNNYLDLKNRGVFFQINLMSLVGHYSKGVQKTAELLIDNNLVDFVGTDCHRLRHLPIIEKSLKSKYCHKLVNNCNLKNLDLIS